MEGAALATPQSSKHAKNRKAKLAIGWKRSRGSNIFPPRSSRLSFLSETAYLKRADNLVPVPMFVNWRKIAVSLIDLPNRFSKSEMQEGEYFAQFEFKGVKYITNFAVIDSYQRCDGTLVEIDFSDAKKAKIQSFVDFNDSGEACRESEPQCYRK
jgi:hypothetical protein